MATCFPGTDFNNSLPVSGPTEPTRHVLLGLHGPIWPMLRG